MSKERDEDVATLKQALRTGYINEEEHAALDRLLARQDRLRGALERVAKAATTVGSSAQAQLEAVVSEARAALTSESLPEEAPTP